MARIQRKTSAYCQKPTKAFKKKCERFKKMPMPKWKTKRNLEDLTLWCKMHGVTYGQWCEAAYKQYCDEKRDKKCKDT